MGHTLKLELDDEIYEPLAKKAKQSGSTPEKLCLEWLEIAIRNVGNDPIDDFIGAFSSTI
ncbi:MAG: hypothetical protein HQ522_15335 [Bacteroidetes bacterium]|nr:hypothetical protein [Bacteroidota bacterium]